MNARLEELLAIREADPEWNDVIEAELYASEWLEINCVVIWDEDKNMRIFANAA